MNDRELDQMLRDMERTTRERDMRNAVIRAVRTVPALLILIVVMALLTGCAKPMTDAEVNRALRQCAAMGLSPYPVYGIVNVTELKGVICVRR